MPSTASGTVSPQASRNVREKVAKLDGSLDGVPGGTAPVSIAGWELD